MFSNPMVAGQEVWGYYLFASLTDSKMKYKM